MKIHTDESLELAAIEIPKKLSVRFRETAPSGKGVCPLNEEIREWLEGRL
jgi:hypothetical protein